MYLMSDYFSNIDLSNSNSRIQEMLGTGKMNDSESLSLLCKTLLENLFQANNKKLHINENYYIFKCIHHVL